MKIKKVLLIVFILVLVLGSTAGASDMPYNPYTYDEWRNPIESPSGYEPTAYIDGIKLGSGLLRAPTDMSVGPDNLLYILDSGGRRIIITDENFENTKILNEFYFGDQEIELFDPQGIFVASDNYIYIADTGNNRALKINTNGEVELIIEKPENELYPQNASFSPLKILVDRTGTIFTIARGIYYGAVMFDPEGGFLGYFGSNRVELTPQLLVDRVWKRLLSKENRDRLPSYIPVEFTNFAVDSENFIYTCTEYSGSNFNMVRKINPMGINILEAKASKSFQRGFGDLQPVYQNRNLISTRFQDISISPEGHISVLDFTRGRVMQYDQDSNILFAFGGLGTQVGMFRAPVALEHLGQKLLVLDRTTGGITVFETTEFGRTVHDAMKLFNDGRYIEAVEPWNDVLRYNSNYNLAYIGLGKAFQETGDAGEAMRHFKIGAFRDGYDRAFNEYRNITLRRVFPFVFSFLIILIIFGYTRKTKFMRKILGNIKGGISYVTEKIFESFRKRGMKHE